MTLYVQRWTFDRTDIFANQRGDTVLGKIRHIVHGMAEAYWNIDSQRRPNETIVNVREKYFVDKVRWVDEDVLSIQFPYSAMEISFGDTLVFDKNGFHIEVKEEDSDKLATNQHLTAVHLSVLEKIDELEKRMRMDNGRIIEVPSRSHNAKLDELGDILEKLMVHLKGERSEFVHILCGFHNGK